jgi:2-oxoglutarate dehydrogenase E1 component
LHKSLEEAKSYKKSRKAKKEEPEHEKFQQVDTTVSEEKLKNLADQLSIVPEGFQIHPKLHHLVKERNGMILQKSKPIDWGTAELLAYGSLLSEGIHIRLSGQDSVRGTFSHRHAGWKDQAVDQTYLPLNHLQPDQARFDAFNSSLSEYAVLGFEFGYSLGYPNALVIWEAQFGDFANGAQVVIDQYISTAEQKWGLKFGLVLFLPHGYEGQGPEHSSGRMERFLTLSAEDNMRIVNPTTPAQFFHLLRRQAMSSLKKPLIVFTPKGLLRHPLSVSTIEDLSTGSFEEIVDDPKAGKGIKRLVLCSGRIYFDLLAAREEAGVKDLAIVRIEQLYPLHEEKLKMLLAKYRTAKRWIWVQEEPINMGAWGFIHPLIKRLLPKGKDIEYIGRSRSASPAVGSHEMHKLQHEEILESLFER